MNKKDINLNPMQFLIADESSGARRIMTEILRAMGVQDIQSAASVLECEKSLVTTPCEVLICDYMIDGGKGPDLIRKIRAAQGHPARYIPILLTCSHSRLKDIQNARDCGANMVVAKPYSVTSLYDRLAWIAWRPRPFVRSDIYCGPDRRFKDEDVEENKRGVAAAGTEPEAEPVASAAS